MEIAPNPSPNTNGNCAFTSQEYAQFFQLSLEMLCIAGFDGYFKEINPAWEKNLGWTTEELLAVPFIEFVHPEDRDRTLQETQKIVQLGHETIYFENRYRCKNGTYKWLCWNSAVSADQQYIYAVARDITEQKVTETALRDQEEFLRSIYESVESAIFVIEVDREEEFRYLSWNASAGRSVKINLQDAVGKTPEEVFGAEKGAKLREHYCECVKTGTPTRSEEKFYVGTQENWMLATLNPVRDLDGRICRLIGTATNITDRKRAEIALQNSETRYREVAQRESIVNRLASQIRESLNLDKILTTAVYEIHRFLGVERCSFSWYIPDENPPIWEVVKEATHPYMPSLIGRYCAETISAATQQALDGQILCIDEVNAYSEPKFREFLSSLGYVSVLLIPIRTRSDGTTRSAIGDRVGVLICGYFSEIHPWTDSEVELLQAVVDQLAIAINQAELYSKTRKAANTAQQKAQELEDTLKELQRTQGQLIQSEKMSSLGQLVAGVAHEINNPVNFIYGNLLHATQYTKDILNLLHLYQEEYPNPTPTILEEINAIELDYLVEDLPKLLSSMKTGAERIREIVKSLRNFSRLDEAEMKEVDIHEGIDSTLLILHHRFKAKSDHSKINIIKEYGALPLVECYPGQLNQVFMNLLSNAIDAIESLPSKCASSEIKTQPGLIQIQTHRIDETNIRVMITDNGSGMSESVRERIFDPFFTTKPIGQGTGLGLSISYSIITNKHGGELNCVSTPNEGTTFILEIPIRQCK